MIKAAREHWPEYLMEAAGLGFFMISAGLFATILEHPDSLARQAIADPVIRRVFMGTAMGLTAIAIIYSPWGKQSGAHINPSVTLTFFWLGKMAKWDAVFYILAQFVGGLAGVLLVAGVIGEWLAAPQVNYVVTVPGTGGFGIAFFAELMISFFLMMVILFVTNTKSLARFTGIFAGVLIASYIALEAPLSGMSMNPARTFASALPAWIWSAFWVYLIAPPLGMLLAAEVYLRLSGTRQVICAKLHHYNEKRCIFRCGYQEYGIDSERDGEITATEIAKANGGSDGQQPL